LAQVFTAISVAFRCTVLPIARSIKGVTTCSPFAATTPIAPPFAVLLVISPTSLRVKSPSFATEKVVIAADVAAPKAPPCFREGSCGVPNGFNVSLGTP
jgi:hypothetical protein